MDDQQLREHFDTLDRRLGVMSSQLSLVTEHLALLDAKLDRRFETLMDVITDLRSDLAHHRHDPDSGEVSFDGSDE